MGSVDPPPADAALLPADRRPWSELVAKLMIGHLLAYPLGFAAAVGSMPIAMAIRREALLNPPPATSRLVQEATRDRGLSPTEVAQLEVLLEPIAIAALVVMLAVHVAVLPYSLAAAGVARELKAGRDPAPALRRRARAGRTFRWVLASTAGVVVLVGAGAWIWLLTL